MKKRRKNKGNRLNYKSNYSSIHHNSSSKSPISQTPSGCLVAVKLSDRQIEAMDRIASEHERLTGESPSLAQIDQLDLVFRVALAKAQLRQSLILEVDWLNWRYHINYAWYREGCPPSGLLIGLSVTEITARASGKGGVQ